MQIKLFLICEKCKVRHNNYITSKSSKINKDKKIVLKKYCKFCQKTQPHKEEIIKGVKSSGSGSKKTEKKK